MEHLAIDLDGRDRKFACAVVVGHIVEERRCPTAGLGGYLASRPRSRVVVETCSEAFGGGLSRENPLWGAPRIHGELLKLGIDVGETSVSKYMGYGRRPPSQTWHTFLKNHVTTMVSVDFFTVPTLRFQVLYVFLVLAHDRRPILHVGVTAHPTAAWTAQQLREAFPWEAAPRYLLRDRDGIFGHDFVAQVAGLGMSEVLDTRLSLATGLDRTRDWHNPARMPGSCHRHLRPQPAPPSQLVRLLLSPKPNPPRAAQGHTRVEINPGTRHRSSGRVSGGGRTAPPIRAPSRLKEEPSSVLAGT